MRAYTLCRDLDVRAAGNDLLTQLRLFPDTLVPAVERLSDTITVARRPFKVGNMWTYGQRRVEMMASSYITPACEFIVLSPPYLRRPWD